MRLLNGFLRWLGNFIEAQQFRHDERLRARMIAKRAAPPKSEAQRASEALWRLSTPRGKGV